MTRCFAGLIAIFMVAACGALPNVAAATAADVSIKPGDLPSGMQRCELSGDVDSYLNSIKTKDPATYATTKKEWEDAQKNGATAAQVVFYTDSAANCASVQSKVANISSATYKLVVNFVVQFKDEASAAKGFTSGKIFGFNRALLKNGGATEGTKTGLGANSIVLSVPIANQVFYIAVWQNKAFMVILGVINIDAATGQKAAAAENMRIH